MSLWIRLDSSYFRHKKTVRLCARLGKWAELIPIKIWTYASQNQPDGDFSGLLAEEFFALIDVEIIQNFTAKAMLKALQEVGFMDGMRIHDWHEHNGFHAAQKEKGKKGAAIRWGKLNQKNIAGLSPGQCPTIAEPLAQAIAQTNKQTNKQTENRAEQQSDPVLFETPKPASQAQPARPTTNGVKLSNEDFLTELRKRYTWLNFDRELEKAKAWLLTPKGRGRKLTQQFVVNWMNKVDSEIQTPQTNGGSPNYVPKIIRPSFQKPAIQ